MIRFLSRKRGFRRIETTGAAPGEVGLTAAELNGKGLDSKAVIDGLLKLHSSAVENQRHFNQLCLTLRLQAITLAVLYVGAITAMASISAGGEAAKIKIFLWEVAYSPIGAGMVPLIIFWWAIKILDIRSYHNMLRATSKVVEKYESSLKEFSPQFDGLSTAISEASRGARGQSSPEENNSPSNGNSKGKERCKKVPASTRRINNFYRWGMAGIILFGLMVTFGIPLAA